MFGLLEEMTTPFMNGQQTYVSSKEDVDFLVVKTIPSGPTGLGQAILIHHNVPLRSVVLK